MMVFSENVCRLCLSQVGVYIIPLFNSLKDKDLCSQIFYFTGVQICEDDNLPNNICKTCYNQIENFKQFKYQVQKTDYILRQEVEVGKKKASEDNINNLISTMGMENTIIRDTELTSLDDEKKASEDNMNNFIATISMENTMKSELQLTTLDDEKKASEDNIVNNFIATISMENTMKTELQLTTLDDEKKASEDNMNNFIATISMENTMKTESQLTTLDDEKVKDKCNRGDILYNFKEKESCANMNNNVNDNKNSVIVQKIANSNFNDPEETTNGAEIQTSEKKLSLQCDVCQKIFKTKTTLRRHSVVHTGHEYHKCVECHKVFAHKHNLVKHFRLHSGVILTCKICQKMFTQPEYLKNHMTYTHSEGDPLSCDVCGKMYKNSITLMVHKKSVHSNITGRNKVVCTVCGKLLGSNALSKHMKTHNVIERIKCDLCDRSYKNRYIMMEHRKSHLKLPASCCDVCGKTFKTNGILKNHKLTHSSEKQFSCCVCGAKFTQSAALRTHQRVHTGIEPYTCSCGERFRWKQTYDKHRFKCTQKSIAVY